MEPVRKIRTQLYAPKGLDGIWWLGNAGFVIRLEQQYVFIDPAVTRQAHAEHEPVHEFPLEPDEIKKADCVLYTHQHGDHMDTGLFPRLEQLKTEIFAPSYCEPFVLSEGIPREKFHIAEIGHSYARNSYTIEVIRARHSSRTKGQFYFSEVEDQDTCACGFLVKTNYGNIYYPGDTYYLKEFETLKVDYLLLPINDTNFGMGDASYLSYQLQPKMIIPCHYGMFEPPPPENWQGGHPAEFLAALQLRKYKLPHTDIMVLKPGGRIVFV